MTKHDCANPPLLQDHIKQLLEEATTGGTIELQECEVLSGSR